MSQSSSTAKLWSRPVRTRFRTGFRSRSEWRTTDAGWKVSSWAPAATAFPGRATPAEGAVAVIVAYYNAISHERYEEAWKMWGSGGEASGQSLQNFRKGFHDTASVRVDPGEPGRVEGAAGSRWTAIPVTITAQTRTGQTQRFAGTYNLSFPVIEGAEQHRWKIRSAEIHELR